MNLRHNLPKKAIETICYYEQGMGEAGWMIYLNHGFSFDPMSDDSTRWIPASDPSEAFDLIIFKQSAAKKPSAADTY